MTKLTSYDEAVVHTFRERAVRSAILIDDMFPCYRDLIDGDLEAIKREYRDWEEARNLLSFLHERHILCDIENRIDEVGEPFIERVRKSDLVVLDWNLKKGDDLDCSDAVRVLDGLSRSKHFNLVVVYTKSKDLQAAWAQAAAQLRGGWKTKDGLLARLPGISNLDDIFDALEECKAEELVTVGIVSDYILDARGALTSHAAKAIEQHVAENSPEKKFRRQVVEALIHRVIEKRFGLAVGDDHPRMLEGANGDVNPWLRCGSVFVTFVSKSTDAAGKLNIFECLDGALKAWKPNILQLLVSELQNELEQNSYAFDGAIWPSDALKAGWIFHLLKATADGEGGDASVDHVVAGINGRIIEALESAVSAQMADRDSTLLSFGRQAAKVILEEAGTKPDENEAERVERAKELVGVSGLQSQDVLHSLNEYLSSDRFRGGHITTGTILCCERADEWFVCVSPACDMVPRLPADDMSWMWDLYPNRPLYLLRLESCGAKSALATAERGVQVFITMQKRRLYLRAIDGTTKQPRPMTCFLREQPLPRDTGTPWKEFGFVVYDAVGTKSGVELKERCLYAVAQLRPAYAARLLHLAGSHTSRVGVDFIKFGSDEEKAKEP